MRLNHLIVTLSAALSAIGLIAGSPIVEATDATHTIQVDGRARSYIVHVPKKSKAGANAKADPNANPGADAPRPVMLIFHGGGGNAAGMVRISAMNDTADAAGFLAVYPNGTGRFARLLTWNAGGCCGYASANNVDDVKFTAQLLDDLAARYHVDRRRVYATGLSNGAMFAYRLAAQLPDRIAAIVPVSATMDSLSIKPTKPVPVMHFHGTADEFASFNGGFGKRSVARFAFTSVNDCIAQWVKVNRCDPKPVVTKLPDTATDDGTTVRRQSYSPRPGGAPVVLYVIEGGGHNWPGRPPIHEQIGPRARRIIDFGPSTRDINANDLMWEFFRQFALPKSPAK